MLTPILLHNILSLMNKIRASIGFSREKGSLREVARTVEEARLDFGSGKVDLAIVFTSFDLGYPGLLNTIASHLGGAPILGCSNQVILSSQGISTEGIAILLLSFPQGIASNTACVKKMATTSPLNLGYELGRALIHDFHSPARDLSIIFSDELVRDGSRLISGMQEQLGTSFPLVGACSSNNLGASQSCLYFNKNVFKNGAHGIILGGKLNFGIGVKHGWQPLGKPRRVTKSHANIVYEIDGSAAVRFYEEYFAFNTNELRKELSHISVLYPIGLHLSGEEEYLLRNIISIEADGSLIVQGDVPEGSEIRLMIGTKESCLAATREALDEIKTRLRGVEISFLLVFNSISRYILLGKSAHEELEIIKEGVGRDIPIIGLYTYGELAPLTAISYRGRSYLHNQTITIVAIGG